MTESYRIAGRLESFDRPSGAGRIFGALGSQGFVRYRELHPGLFSVLPPGAHEQQADQEWMALSVRTRFANCETDSQRLQDRCAP